MLHARNRAYLGLALSSLLILFTSCGSNSGSTSGTPKTSVTTASDGMDGMAGMDHSGTMAMDPVAGDGTKDSAAGYTLQPITVPTAIGTQPYSFKVVGPDGAAIKDAEVEQTKKLHLIVVRSDLSLYQHIHPALAADGTWTIPVSFATEGRWHIIADLTPVKGTRVVLGTDVSIGGAGANQALPAAEKTAKVDGFVVTMGGQLTTAEKPVTFAITKDGAPATNITDYLGAGGHLVALKVDTLAYTHLHPNSAAGPSLSFDAAVPTAGTYRLFLQFASGAQVHTAEFTVVATS